MNDTQKAIEKAKEKPMTALDFISAHKNEFATVIPQHLSADRMMRLALSAIRTTPHLAECTIQSVAVSLMACSALGLEPNTPLGHAYLIPFNSSVKRNGQWTKEYRCSLIVGYRGFIELFYRSGVVDSVQAFPVFEGDKFEVKFGLHPDLVHVPSNDKNRWNPKKLTHVYGVINLKNSERPMWSVMDRNQIDMRRERSKSKDDGPWITDFIPMALKTVIRDMSRWVPFSVDKVAAAAAYEGALESGNHRQAIIALGPDAQESAGLLLEGVAEDEPLSAEPEEKPTLETVAASKSEKPSLDKELRDELVATARSLWGDECMMHITQILRRSNTGFSDANRDQLSAALDEVLGIINAGK
jgi:recombination protein RecT